MSPARTSKLRQRLVRIALYSVLTAGAAFALVYGADYCIFRLRQATNHQPFGSVTVTRYYAVPQKNGKTEFLFDPPAPQTCAHSLFAQAGYSPCWYLERHTDQRIDM